MAILPMTPAPELFGEEVEEDALFKVRLRRITYSSGITDPLEDAPVSCLQWQTQKVRVLHAATLERLVAELTPVDGDVDPSFLIVFLSTYRGFTTTKRLLKTLFARVSSLLEPACPSTGWESPLVEQIDSAACTLSSTCQTLDSSSSLRVEEVELSPRPVHQVRQASSVDWDNTSCGSAAQSSGNEQHGENASEVGSVLSDRDASSGANRERCDIIRSVLAVFRLWLDQYPEDFSSPTEKMELRTLLDLCQGHQDYEELERYVDAIFDGKEPVSPLQQYRSCRLAFEASEVLNNHSRDRPTPHIDFLSIPAVIIARQLTLLDAELFYHVVPYHCLGCVWSRRNKIKGGAPTVSATVNQFNRVCMLVTTTILKGIRDHRLESKTDRPVQRAYVLEHWLQIAQECRRLKNFSSLRAIVSSINSSSIERLTKTWARVSKESQALFEDLVMLTSHSDNDQISRSLLMKEGTSKYSASLRVPKGRFGLRSPDTASGVVQGVVPYLGTFLTDLTMIDTAHPDYINGNLINFEKRRKEFEVLAQLMLFQKAASNYVFDVDNLIQSWILFVDLLDEEASYQRSLVLEPTKEKSSEKTSKIARFKALLTKEKPSSAMTGSLPREALPNVTMVSQYQFRRLSFPDNHQILGVTNHAFELHKKSEEQRSRESFFKDAYIIRVRLGKHFSQMPSGYKSFLLTNGDRARTVIQRVLEKNLLDGDPNDFYLLQIIPPSKELRIPIDANVYYALNTSTDQFNFVLEKHLPGTPDSQGKPSKSFFRQSSRSAFFL